MTLTQVNSLACVSVTFSEHIRGGEKGAWCVFAFVSRESRFTIGQERLVVEDISILLISIYILKDDTRYRTLRSISWNRALYAIDIITVSTRTAFIAKDHIHAVHILAQQTEGILLNFRKTLRDF